MIFFHDDSVHNILTAYVLNKVESHNYFHVPVFLKSNEEMPEHHLDT
jgi:hypothetical protein